MSDHDRTSGPAAISRTSMEIVTSLVIAGVGIVALWDSRRLGAGWGTDGPQAGYFPFFIALILVLASLGNLVQLRRQTEPGEAFLTRPQLGLVLTILVPAVVYVAAIPFVGIYVASAVLVTWFMRMLGGFSWKAALPTALGIAAAAFITFEIWFLVALPKGPLEAFLGY
jgi:hypothetical protein